MNSLITRTLSGAVFLCVLLAGILIHPYGYALLMLVIIALGMREFYRITLPKNTPLRQAISYATGLILFLLLFLSGMGIIQSKVCWLIVVPIACIFIQELYSKAADPFRSIALSITGVIYISLPFTLLNVLTLDGQGNYDHTMLLSFFILLWTNDVGAYCFGMLFGRHGRHKLFERISPKKSWEGFWGGTLASLGTAFVLFQTWGNRYELALPHWLALAFIISLMGTYGDLAESLLKRSAGVKDSGNLLPGHGGILDRFDGALLAFPCAIAYWQMVKLF